MMGAHANNMMAQAPAQNQFLPQNQFSSSGGAMSVNSAGLGQPAAPTGVSQVHGAAPCPLQSLAGPIGPEFMFTPASPSFLSLLLWNILHLGVKCHRKMEWTLGI